MVDGQAAGGIADHVGGIDMVARLQKLAQSSAAFGLLPPVEIPRQRLTRSREHARVEQTGVAQVQHHLGDAAGQEHLHDDGEHVDR